MKIRTHLQESDLAAIKELLESTSFFYDYEIDIAIELANENLSNGSEKSGYIFRVSEQDGSVTGFSCYGKTPCTKDSFDLYWIAVHSHHQGKGIGKKLLKECEEQIYKLGGRNIWVETSSRELYAPTRNFYLAANYNVAAELPDFYGPGDSKIVFRKHFIV